MTLLLYVWEYVTVFVQIFEYLRVTIIAVVETEIISEEEAAKLAAQSEGTEPEANEGEGTKDENPAEGEGTEDNGPQEGTVTLAAEVDNIIENPNFDDAAKTQALIDLAAEHNISLGRAKNLGRIAEIIKSAKGE